MNEWFKKTGTKFKENWSKWSIVQKLILVGIVLVAIGVIVVMAKSASKPVGVKLFGEVIEDKTAQRDVLFELDNSGIKYNLTADGFIIVQDEPTAVRARVILTDKNLVPKGTDPWGFLGDTEPFAVTDFERDNKKKQAIIGTIKKHLEALSFVSNVDLQIGFPDNELFTDDQKPLTASVILSFKNGYSVVPGSKEVKTVQKLLLNSVPGLRAEFVTIADKEEGRILNDFEGQAAFDKLTQAEREQKLRDNHQAQVRARILKALQSQFTDDRVRDVSLTIDWNLSEVVSEKTIYTPIEITPQDPEKPYDTRETRDYLPLASQTITNDWQGTGYNPEGPSGVEGQNPPVYSDMSNVIGHSTQTSVTQNNVINTEKRHENVHSQPGRVSVAVNIDGVWELKLDPKTHEPEVDEETGHLKWIYTEVSALDLERATSYLQSAIGYNKLRGDSVTVTNIQIDRRVEQREYEANYFASQNRKKAIMVVLSGIILILIAFIIFKFISKELERRRRLREEQLLKLQQEAREKALWEARDQDMQVTMSVEERKRAELQENAIAMAKEHPEDVAMLIRTWLMDDNN